MKRLQEMKRSEKVVTLRLPKMQKIKIKKNKNVGLKGSFVSCCAAPWDQGSLLSLQSCWSWAGAERLQIPGCTGGHCPSCRHGQTLLRHLQETQASEICCLQYFLFSYMGLFKSLEGLESLQELVS